VRSSLHDPILVLASFGAVAAFLAVARLLGGWSADARRKWLHVSVGAWVLFVTPRFGHLAWALVPPVVFIAVNASRLLRDRFPELAEDPGAARGLWTFPLGVAISYLLFWNDGGRVPILAGVAALTFADPAAALVGRRWGQRRYRGFGFGRSLEGTLAFLVVAAIASGWIASCATPPGPFLRYAVGCGAAGAAVEAFAPPGWDNVVIPVAVAFVFGALG
jgi:dolichol kinase